MNSVGGGVGLAAFIVFVLEEVLVGAVVELSVGGVVVEFSVAGGVVSAGAGGGGGMATNLSLLNTPKPAIGIDETFVNNFCWTSVPGIFSGVNPETFAGGVVLV